MPRIKPKTVDRPTTTTVQMAVFFRVFQKMGLAKMALKLSRPVKPRYTPTLLTSQTEVLKTVKMGRRMKIPIIRALGSSQM